MTDERDDKVVDFQAEKNAREAGGWFSGEAVCLDCRHRWAVVIPADAASPWLECPNCTLKRGRFYGHHEPPLVEHRWTCPCGNDLFYLTPRRTQCPNCGRDQRFPGGAS